MDILEMPKILWFMLCKIIKAVMIAINLILYYYTNNNNNNAVSKKK